MAGWVSKGTARNARRVVLVALLGVLGLGVWGAYALLAAPAPSAPTITASPANPSTSATASFSYKDSTTAGFTRFECSKDGGTYAACGAVVGGSSLSYAATDGSRTFAVRAVFGTTTTATTSYSWTVDTVRPSLSSITRSGATPTNVASASWTVTFSEAVKNVAAANFALAPTALTGTPAITSVSGSGATWTVTASTGTSTTGQTGSLGLNLTAAGTITDLAGNPLTTGSVPTTGQVYGIDKLAPQIQFTQKPSDPSSDATAYFNWSQLPADPNFDHYECSVENGSYAPCTPSPFALDTSNNGQHQLSVRAFDKARNFSQIDYKWKVAKGSLQDFTISGNAVGSLLPGGATRSINLVFTNPNSVPITVLSASASVAGVTPLPGKTCNKNDFGSPQPALQVQVVIPANSTKSLTDLGVATANWPTIRMLSNANQDGCKNATVNLSYSGSAQG